MFKHFSLLALLAAVLALPACGKKENCKKDARVEKKDKKAKHAKKDKAAKKSHHMMDDDK